jgi:DNA-binding transcriptional LysR family regulator
MLDAQRRGASMRTINLDMDVLRTFSRIVELDGFAKAADSVGRSQSAVSLQIKKLEEQIGGSVFRREGRRLVLTDIGRVLLNYSGKILELNDQAIAATQISKPESIRLGVPADVADTLLPSVLTEFALEFPHIAIEARVDRNLTLVEQTQAGQIDLALAFSRQAAEIGQEIATLPMQWIGAQSIDAAWHAELPLVVFDAPCMFRDVGISALEQVGTRWRIALTSPSLAGLWAATKAGLGVSIRTPLGLPETLRTLGPDEGLPRLQTSIGLALLHAEGTVSPHVARLSEIVRGQVDQSLQDAA